MELLELNIPDGLYCYSEKGVCPYWKRISKFNAYCSYLKKSDKDISSESLKRDVVISQNNKKRLMSLEEKKNFRTSFSLLWDQCKECNINMDDE